MVVLAWGSSVYLTSKRERGVGPGLLVLSPELLHVPLAEAEALGQGLGCREGALWIGSHFVPPVDIRTDRLVSGKMRKPVNLLLFWNLC